MKKAYDIQYSSQSISASSRKFKVAHSQAHFCRIYFNPPKWGYFSNFSKPLKISNFKKAVKMGMKVAELTKMCFSHPFEHNFKHFIEFSTI